MRYFLFVFFHLHCCFAQDSIFFRDKHVEVANISEIGIDHIKYVKLNNANGPVYVKLKTEIDYVRFKNGDVERYPVSINQGSSKNTASKTEFQLLSFTDKKLYRLGRPVGDGHLKKLIDNYPDVSRRKTLNDEFMNMKKYTKRQYGWGIGGPPTAGAVFVFFFAMAIVPVDPQPQYLAIGTALSAAVLIISLSESRRNRLKRYDQKKKIAEMYNAYQLAGSAE